jgi:Zn-dependent M16 (insulinase) family peptidase
VARFYRHGRTGAELLSLINSDENKVFGVSFATPPSDSTGVAHILEHSVLCGSRKYPVKEPFVELMKSSVSTFLNAMTFPDKTCYPVASQNVQDFYNLIDVYLDAVFVPRLTPQTFQQEGWHYELDAPDAPLIYKGVVLNEMKGNYSSPDTMLRELSQRSLYPDITYGFDAGGDPKHIPDLTYEQLKAFHEQHYHPSNAKLFFYGDDDPDERLRLLDARLGEFNRITVNAKVPLQPRFTAPKRLIHTYPASPADEQPGKPARETMLTVNWMIPREVTSIADTCVLYHDLFTNGILYLDLGFDLHVLPPELLSYVPLFGRALLETGVENDDFVRLSQRIGRSTGGIRPQRWTSTVVGGLTSTAWLYLRGKALPGQTVELLSILQDILGRARLDNRARFRQLVLEEKASLESRLVPAGSSYVDRRLRASLYESDWADEQMSGVTYLFFLRKLAEDVETKWDAVLAALEGIRSTLVNRAAMLCNVTAEASHWAPVEPQLANFLGALPRMSAKAAPWSGDLRVIRDRSALPRRPSPFSFQHGGMFRCAEVAVGEPEK